MTDRVIDFDRPKQQRRNDDLLKFITEQIKTQECTPTYREMAQSIGVSKALIWEHLERLEMRGEIVTITTSEGNYRPNSLRLAKRAIYFEPAEWLRITTAWGDDAKAGILRAAEQIRYVVTAP